uniref:fimbrillin family protein n=1 Tax=uncultured Parabacteroides sp. TaxID=512312 RepID=UPI0025CB7E7B
KPVPTVTLRVKVKNATETSGVVRTYTTELTYLTSGFASGKQYTYTATLKANGITFDAAKVEDWTDGTLGDGGSNSFRYHFLYFQIVIHLFPVRLFTYTTKGFKHIFIRFSGSGIWVRLFSVTLI